MLTAAQLERALRAFRRLRSEDAGESHELEYVAYHWGEDGSLYLRARLPAEDGTLVVRALEAARGHVRARRLEERAAQAEQSTMTEGARRVLEPPRPPAVEALVEVARSSLVPSVERPAERACLVVHVDALALITGRSGVASSRMAP